MAKVILPEGTAAATPAAGTVVFYAKADGLLYSKDDAGTETKLGSSGAGDVVGPASATADSMALYNGTTGKLLKDGILPGTGIATALAVNVGTSGAPVINGGALGTPSSGTLTNVTGLPVAGISASTSTALGVGSIELGHASDTTLTRIAAGRVAIEGNEILTSTSAISNNEQSLTAFFTAANGSAYQDCYRAGFLPSWFNQQWGGAQWGTLPDGSFGSVATCQIEDNGAQDVSGFASAYYRSAGFKVAETTTYDSVWVKLYKTGNPTYNLTLRIYSDSTGSPNTAIGAASTVSAKALTSKSDGEWVQFTGLSVALTAGTQYHITLSSLAAVDATNYVQWKYTNNKKYPHGNLAAGTSAPVWTPNTTSCPCFLIQNPTANSLIQSAGMFDYKLAFNPGTPVNQSRSVAQPLANFYDGKTCSVLYRGTFAISTNVWDFTYGLDHDRITLTIDASGYPVLTIYESDRTVATVTGTGSVASGNHDVGIRVRTVGDGADYATLYVDGVSVGTPLTSQTFTMAPEMRQLGTARLGDGFGLAPTWTQDMQMTSLPSAQGWTSNVSLVTEANSQSIQSNKLYQNKNGLDAAGAAAYSFYSKTFVFVNGTGGGYVWKGRVPNNTNTSGATGSGFTIIYQDGSKRVDLNIQEYFLQTLIGGALDITFQGDFKTVENVITLQVKGSDYWVFVNGKVAIDGTGRATGATATNAINIGDANATSGENADAITSYFKTYQGGLFIPTATTGTCSEFAHWSGDKSSLLPSLWNSGTPVSVKQLCGVPRNYQYEAVVQREVRRGVTSSPTSTSSADALIAEMECYVIGSAVKQDQRLRASTAAANVPMGMTTYLDGRNVGGGGGFTASNATAGYPLHITGLADTTAYLGLHKVEARQATPSSTITDETRTLTVEARS